MNREKIKKIMKKMIHQIREVKTLLTLSKKIRLIHLLLKAKIKIIIKCIFYIHINIIIIVCLYRFCEPRNINF